MELVNKYIREALPKLDEEQNHSQRFEAESNAIINNSHFSVNKSYEEMQRILTALQQQGFISTGITIETFYYRMTGQGTPTSNKIEWIKKGRKNNSSISKRALVYFVETFTGCRVSKARESTSKITEIFGLSLSSSTINSTAVCEYKAEIDNIVEAKNNLTGLFAR